MKEEVNLLIVVQQGYHLASGPQCGMYFPFLPRVIRRQQARSTKINSCLWQPGHTGRTSPRAALGNGRMVPARCSSPTAGSVVQVKGLA
jgi:hypothetical protein